MKRRDRRTAWALTVCILGAMATQAACNESSTTSGAADAALGPELIRSYGCQTCHTIPGVAGADATVGPPLTAFGDRRYIAGEVSNTGPNLIRWIMDPQSIEPKTVMPDAGVTERDARNIAAYLETLHS
ncbi:MAG: c-type cytochrome [Actinomycetota bacterium]|jgi:cytochrome c